MGVCVVRRVQLFVTQWTVTHQAPLVHGVLQAKILERVAISSSRRSSHLRDRTWVSCIGVDSLPLSHLGSP